MLQTGEDIRMAFKAFAELKHSVINCFGKHDFYRELSDIVHNVVDLERRFEDAVKDSEQYKEYKAEEQKALNEWCENYRKLSNEVTTSSENHISNYYGDSWDKDPETGNWHRSSWGF